MKHRTHNIEHGTWNMELETHIMKKEKKKRNINKKLRATRFVSRDRGFTLIEMMVALSLFMIVMTVALGSLLTIIHANKKSQSLQTLMTNLNFVIDDISRNARVGTTYYCDNNLINLHIATDCPLGGTVFAFENTRGDPNDSGDQVVFRFINSSIEKSTDGGANFSQVTSPDITINDMKFFVRGALIGDSKQPKVLIRLDGIAGTDSSIQTKFDIQTTITQRLLDF